MSWRVPGWVLIACLGGCSASENSQHPTPGGQGGLGALGGAAGSGGASSPGGAAPSGAAGTRSGAGTAGATSAGAASGGAGSPAAAPTGMCELVLSCTGEIPDDTKRECELEVRDAAGLVVYDALAGVELRGRSSIEYAKKNYAVELRLPNALENPQNLFGMGQESDWIFDGSWVDRSFMRNDLVFELFRDLGHYGAESRYCNLTLNGEERGIYRLVERVKRDDDRLELSLDDGTGQSFLIKQDDTGLLRFDVGAEDRWQIVYPRQDEATAAQVDAIQQWLDGLNDALQAPQAAGVFTFLDPASTTDYVLVQEFAKNIDAYNLSLHLARNMGGLAKFVPWDTDLAFGQPTLRNQMNEATSGWVNTRTLLIRSLAQNPDLKARLGPRWRELRAGPLAEAAVFAKLDRYAAALLPAAVERNFRIWPIADVDFSEIYSPYTLYSVASHAEELTRLRSWISARLTWVDDHIDAYPSAM